MHSTRLLSGFAVGLAVLQANAVSTWTQLDAQNTGKQRLSFTIKTEKTGRNLRFRVVVAPKDAALSPLLNASLAVFDGTNRVVSCAVEPARRDPSATYEFEVSPKYLEKSTFTFGNMAESHGQPMPAGDFYWFYLKDVAREE